jgi:hypothetical protein
MIFVMKRIINYAFYAIIVTSIFYLVTTMNSLFVLISLEPSYSTTFNPAGPFNPDGGNTEPEGIPRQPNTNPASPIEDGYIPINLDKSANLTIYPIRLNNASGMDYGICVFTSYPSALIYFRYEVPANPYCVEGLLEQSSHEVLAPGLIGVRATSSIYDIDTSDCEFYIYPNASKYCYLSFTKKPYLTTPQETVAQGGTLQVPSR